MWRPPASDTKVDEMCRFQKVDLSGGKASSNLKSASSGPRLLLDNLRRATDKQRAAKYNIGLMRPVVTSACNWAMWFWKSGDDFVLFGPVTCQISNIFPLFA